MDIVRGIKNKNRKIQEKSIHVFTFSFFYIENVIFCSKKQCGKTQFLSLHLRYSFLFLFIFFWAESYLKHSNELEIPRMFCKTSLEIPIQHFFNVDFDSDGIYIFDMLKKYFRFRKNKSMNKRNDFVHLVTRSTYCIANFRNIVGIQFVSELTILLNL